MVSACPRCGRPLCPDCGRCPAAGHKPTCQSEEARRIMARLAKQELDRREATMNRPTLTAIAGRRAGDRVRLRRCAGDRGGDHALALVGVGDLA
jgi:uncharacterized Zn finger protein (UPF0148 family)